MRCARPWGAGRRRFSIRPPSTKIVFMNKSASSMRASGYFTCQLAIADSKRASIRAAPCLGSNLSTLRACCTFLPRTKSATKRIFCGEVGTFFSFAIASISCIYRCTRTTRFTADNRHRAGFLAFTFIFFGYVTTEVPGRGKFPKLMAYHIFGYIHRNKLVTVVYRKGMPYKIRRHHAAAAPGFYYGFFAGIIEHGNLGIKASINIRAFFQRTSHVIFSFC